MLQQRSHCCTDKRSAWPIVFVQRLAFSTAANLGCEFLLSSVVGSGSIACAPRHCPGDDGVLGSVFLVTCPGIQEEGFWCPQWASDRALLAAGRGSGPFPHLFMSEVIVH